MPAFDPASFQMPQGHFMGGRVVEAPNALTVRVDKRAVQQEIFGPVLTIQIFDDEEEGPALAAHGSYGLAARRHGRSCSACRTACRAMPCKRQLRRAEGLNSRSTPSAPVLQ